MTDQLLIRDDTSLAVHFRPQAEALKAEALEKSAIINRVRNAAENAAAVEAQQELERVLKLAESSRESVKKPVLDLCRAIDKTAADFKAELLAERMRLGKLCGD